MNNPIAFIDPDGMAARYNWVSGQYENEKGEQVNFAEAMASHGMNTDGSEKVEEPPINLYRSDDKTSGNTFAKERKYKEGDGVFELFGHGNYLRVHYQDAKGENQIADTPDKVYKLLMERSPQWRNAMKSGKKVTLILYACNTASYEFIDRNGKFYKGKPIAQSMSESKLFKNVTIIAPDGYTTFADFSDNRSDVQFLGVGNHKKDGGFLKFLNGILISKQPIIYEGKRRENIKKLPY